MVSRGSLLLRDTLLSNYFILFCFLFSLKRSAHAPKLNPALHDCCRIISGCLKPTNLDSVHLLAGIAPPHIRRTVACRMERTRQTTADRHQLFHHQPAASRLKSRKSFMRTVTPLDSSASSSRLQLWKDSLTDVPSSVKMGLEVAESLPAGSGEDWLCWRAITWLRTGVGRAKTTMRRWGYLDDAQSVDYDCGEPQTMAHLLSCRLLDEACTADDLATVTERASGRTLCEGHERRISALMYFMYDHATLPPIGCYIGIYAIGTNVWGWYDVGHREKYCIVKLNCCKKFIDAVLFFCLFLEVPWSRSFTW